MTWTALLPYKPQGERKTRLSSRLSVEERAKLADALFAHVVGVLKQSPHVATTVILSRERPTGWQGDWIEDHGRGLNPELEAARATLGAAPLLILHTDLPLLAKGDVAALITAAQETGCAIAPDRHGTGTNALALADGRAFSFRFGAGSFRLHRTQGGNSVAVVTRPSLGLDVDMPVDLDEAIAQGFAPF